MQVTQRKYFQDVVGGRGPPQDSSSLKLNIIQHLHSFISLWGRSVYCFSETRTQTLIIKCQFSQMIQKESMGEDMRTYPKNFKILPDMTALQNNFLLGDCQAPRSEISAPCFAFPIHTGPWCESSRRRAFSACKEALRQPVGKEQTGEQTGHLQSCLGSDPFLTLRSVLFLCLSFPICKMQLAIFTSHGYWED